MNLYLSLFHFNINWVPLQNWAGPNSWENWDYPFGLDLADMAK